MVCIIKYIIVNFPIEIKQRLALQAIERQYSETKVWELGTPYFEKRNINFYVNKCGFHIVEFYNKYHPDPHMHHDENDENQLFMEEDGFFRFEKIMK